MAETHDRGAPGGALARPARGEGAKSTVLVTGATGNVGGAVLAALNDWPGRVVAAVTDPIRAAGRVGPDVACVPFDFTRPETFAAAFAGVRRLLLVRPPALANVGRDIAPAIAAARAAGVERVVFVSLLGAERNPIVPHFRIERLLRASGMAWTFLRPGYFMQNLGTTHRDEIRDERAIFVPAGRGKTSFIDVRDIAGVAARALTEGGHAGKAYPLTGAAALGYATVAELFGAVLGRQVRYADPSPLAYLRRQAAHGLPLPFTLVTLALYTTARLGLAATVTGEVARLLGREPVTMRRYIEDHRDTWR